jgi:hypothetical protein
MFDLPRHPPPDDRKVFVCHATSSGGVAWGASRGTTFFSLALTRCLAGDESAVPAADGTGWAVTTGSLATALPRMVERLAREAGLPKELLAKQEVSVLTTESGGGAVVLKLAQAPTVPVTMKVEPAAAARRARVEVKTDTFKPVAVDPTDGRDGTVRFLLPAGVYFAHVSFEAPPGGPAERDVRFITSVAPPSAVWVIDAEPPEATTPP